MLAIGCDHAGYELKQEIIKHLEEKGIEYKDFGCYSEEAVDYPVYGKLVGHAVADGECEKGILICGTGIGISMAANKIKGVRAALCSDCFSAEATRLHNDANILAMGGRVVGTGLALKQSEQRAARTPLILLAAMEIPIPVPQKVDCNVLRPLFREVFWHGSYKIVHAKIPSPKAIFVGFLLVTVKILNSYD